MDFEMTKEKADPQLAQKLTETLNSPEFAKQIEEAKDTINRVFGNVSPEGQEEIKGILAMQFAKMSIIQETRLTAERRQLLDRIDLAKELDAFYATLESKYTRDTYLFAISFFQDWAAINGACILTADCTEADGYIDYLKGHYSPATVRQKVAAISSFYSFLERRHRKNNLPIISNPFRGTKARPKERAVREIRQPSAKEVQQIIAGARGERKLAFSLMANEGLRIGGLPGIVIKGDRYETISKGKRVTGELSPETKAIFTEGKFSAKPFEKYLDKSHDALTQALYAEQRRLNQGNIFGVVYNPHSFRHYYACRLYEQTKDIHLVSKKLHHASILVTERYLQKLNVID